MAIDIAAAVRARSAETTLERFTRRRKRREATLRVLDLIAYAVITLSGAFALTIPPQTIQDALNHQVITMWGIMLIISGSAGFFGRFTRFWVIEAPGAAAGSVAGLVYLVVLVYATATGLKAGAVGATFIACMSLLLARRYIELSLFTDDDSGPRPLRVRMRDAFKRRTKDSISSDLN